MDDHEEAGELLRENHPDAQGRDSWVGFYHILITRTVHCSKMLMRKDHSICCQVMGWKSEYRL